MNMTLLVTIQHQQSVTGVTGGGQHMGGLFFRLPGDSQCGPNARLGNRVAVLLNQAVLLPLVFQENRNSPISSQRCLCSARVICGTRCDEMFRVVHDACSVDVPAG